MRRFDSPPVRDYTDLLKRLQDPNPVMTVANTDARGSR